MRGVFEKNKHLILFIPIKSEKYLVSQHYISTENFFIKHFESEYKNLISIFDYDTVANNVCIAVTPIQTIGGVVFSKLKNNKFIYKKRDSELQYQPQNVDQPLRHILSFAIKEYKKNLGLFQTCSDNFENAEKHLEEGIKEDRHFKILKNPHFVLNNNKQNNDKELKDNMP